MEVLKQNLLTRPAFLPVSPDSLPEPLGYPEDTVHLELVGMVQML